jgi:phosphate transport system substrate-binding protein
VREDGAWIDVAGDYGVLLGKLAGDADAVAVFTYSYFDQNRDRIQVARLEGIAPAPPTILDFSYPAARPLFIYVKAAHAGVVPGLVELVQEYLSEAAAGKDGYLVDRGLVPLPPAWLEIERRKATALATPKP